MSNFRRRLMMSIKKEEKYTQLEYIEDTGTQHINTEVKTKQSLKIECIFSGNQVSTLLFGARKTASLDGLAWGFNNTDYAFSGFGGSTKKNNTTVNTIDGKKHTVVLSNEVYTIDDVNQSLPNRGTFSNFYDIYLFTWNNANVADTRKFKGKVYNFKIYDNNVLIRDMIPVLDKNGIACMYDKVNKEFYYNQGAGEFIAGPLENYFNYEDFYNNYVTVPPSNVGRYAIKLEPNTSYIVSTNLEANGISKVFVVSGSNTSWSPSTGNNGVMPEKPRTITTDSEGNMCIGIYVSGANIVNKSEFENGTAWVKIKKVED